MATITGQIDAWLTEHSQAEFMEGRGRGDTVTMIGAVKLLDLDMTSHGWTRIGRATVALEIDDDNTIRKSMVDALREQKKSVLAEAQREATRIEERIQNLLAITFDEGAR